MSVKALVRAATSSGEAGPDLTALSRDTVSQGLDPVVVTGCKRVITTRRRKRYVAKRRR
jgi:hypothetical protein